MIVLSSYYETLVPMIFRIVHPYITLHLMKRFLNLYTNTVTKLQFFYPFCSKEYT